MKPAEFPFRRALRAFSDGRSVPDAPASLCLQSSRERMLRRSGSVLVLRLEGLSLCMDSGPAAGRQQSRLSAPQVHEQTGGTRVKMFHVEQ